MSEAPAADAAEEFIEEFDADVWMDEPSGPSLITKMLAEVAGTFILVLLGVGTALTLGLVSSGALVIQGQTQGNVFGAPTSVVGFAFAIAVIIAAFAFGMTSGAHLNPAVTLGAVARRPLPRPRRGAVHPGSGNRRPVRRRCALRRRRVAPADRQCARPT